MAADQFFLSKLSPQDFCNIDMCKYKFKMCKRLWITVNQTNRWAGSVFRGSV